MGLAVIYLYESTETDFRYNGKPLSKAYQVPIKYTLNSEHYVKGRHPLDEDMVYKEIVEDRIVKVHTPDGMQPFRIVDIKKHDMYIEFEAWPLFYADMRNKVVKPLELKNVNGQAALNAFVNNLLIDTPFTFYSDITDNRNYNTQGADDRENNPNQLYDALEVFSSIVSRWQGELWIRGYDIRLNKRIGTDTEAMLYEKKNISNFLDSTNIEGIVTRLHGKSDWQDERQEGEEEGQKHSLKATVDSPLINSYSGVIFEKQYTNNDIRTERELINWLELKFTTNNIDKPSRTIEVGANTIGNTSVKAGDTLILKYLKHDVDMRIKVVGYEYDGFNNEYTNVVLGEPKLTTTSTIGNTITDLVNNVIEPIDRKSTIAMNSADGKSTVFHGTADPNTLNLNTKENDTYFRTNGSEKEIWRFTGTVWELIIDTSDTTKNSNAISGQQQEIEDAKDLAENAESKAQGTIDTINQVVDDNGFTTLSDLFASKISADEYGTMFYQNAEAIGLVYEENGEQVAIIGIQEGKPYIKGRHIVLDGDTIVDGEFTVTESMLAPEAIIERLIATGIDAADVTIINLDVDSITGGDIELSRGFRITNNGVPVLDVNGQTGEVVMNISKMTVNTIPVATQEDIETIELTPGPQGEKGDKGDTGERGSQGPQGVQGPTGEDGKATYTWIRYADTSTGGGISNSPTGKEYIGLAHNKDTDIETDTPGDYTWSLIRGPQGETGNRGVEGPKGDDGQTTYTWIKYSANANGSDLTDTPQANTAYIGIATNKTTQAETNTPGDYTWSLFKGPKGDVGEQGPRGLQGQQGPEGKQGIQGSEGVDGVSSYTHIAYSTSNTGADFSHSTFENATYIGMYVSDEIDSSETPGDYEWTLIKGKDGSQGLRGPEGKDGLTPYFHTAWANNSTGTSGFSTTDSANKLYIGTATTFESDDPEEPSEYNWTKIKGDKGETGSTGPKGDAGKGITAQTITYQNHTNGTTAPTGSWTSSPNPVKGRYLWTRTVTTYTEGNPIPTYAVAYNATDGQNGSDGTGIDSTEIRYQQSTSGNQVPTGTWHTTIPNPVEGSYLWTRTLITYTDDTTSTSYSTSYYATKGEKGDKGDKGDQGPQGATGSQGPRGNTGTSVESITEYYLATSVSSGISSTNTGFKTTMQSMSPTNKYLWNYEKINFSDGTSQPTIPVIIGVYGDKGQTGSTGATGRSIVSITEHYLATSANTGVTRSTSGWSTSMKPTTETNKYLWNYETINWSSGTTPTYVEPIIIGVHGQKGDTGAKGDKGETGAKGATGSQGPRGATGVSVDSITEHYLATSLASGVTTSTSGWTTTLQPMTSAKKYLWNYEEINFSDSTSQPTIPVIIGVYGDKGDKGAEGDVGRSITAIKEHYLISASSSGVTRTTGGWSETMKVTTESLKYLWNYETITWNKAPFTTYVEPIVIGVHGAKGTTGSKGDTGAKGDRGPQGIQGPTGSAGQSQWVHIRYSANSNGSSMTPSPVAATKYVGIAVTNAEAAPIYTGFKWSKYVGENGVQGPQGIQGPPGANGQPTYTWIKYADTPTSGMNDFPDGKKYIGLAFNQTSQNESTSYSAYQWSLMPQNIEIGGRNLLVGTTDEWIDVSAPAVTHQSMLDGFSMISLEDIGFSGGEDFVAHIKVKDINEPIRFRFEFFESASARTSVFSQNLEPTNGIVQAVVKDVIKSGYSHIRLQFSPNGHTRAFKYSYSELKLERGDVATDWTPAPEDVDEKIDGVNDSVNDSINEVSTSLAEVRSMAENKVDSEAYDSFYEAYTNFIESYGEDQSGVIKNLQDAMDRVATIEHNLGESAVKWNFINNSIKAQDEGILLESENSNMSILMGMDAEGNGRISFFDNNVEVAFISEKVLQINHGIFVKTARVGPIMIHQINEREDVVAFSWVGE